MPSRNKRFLFFALALMSSALGAQDWIAQNSGSHASLRGLSAVNESIVWASGTGGTVVRTVDGGVTWQTVTVPGAERVDFRDIKAFSGQVAYVMGIAGDGGIYKTTDGGRTWIKQYSNSAKGFFLDSITFEDLNHGLAVGDPMNGRFLVVHTHDGGATWTEADSMPPALPGEGAFAASGTSLVAVGHDEVWFGTGGTNGARIFHSTDGGSKWTVLATLIMGPAPAAGAGIFSLAFRDARHGIAVGGDYTQPNTTAHNVLLTDNGGKVWTLPSGEPPAGYRSCVAYVPDTHGMTLITVGTSGSDVSTDGGRSWSNFSKISFNSVAFASGKAGWAVGGQGVIARFQPAPK